MSSEQSLFSLSPEYTTSISAVAGPAAAPAPAFTPDRPTQPSADSPIVRTVNSTKTTVEDNDADSQYMHLAKEIEKHLVGPMPVKDFVDAYMPQPPRNRHMPSHTDAFEDIPLPVPKKPKDEKPDAKLKGSDLNRPLVRLMMYLPSTPSLTEVLRLTLSTVILSITYYRISLRQTLHGGGDAQVSTFVTPATRAKTNQDPRWTSVDMMNMMR